MMAILGLWVSWCEMERNCCGWTTTWGYLLAPPGNWQLAPEKLPKLSTKGSSSKLRGCIMDSDLTRNCLLGWSTNELNKKLAKIHEVLGILIWEESRLVICSHLPCFKGYINWTRCNSRAFLAAQVDLALKEMIYVKLHQENIFEKPNNISWLMENMGLYPTLW